MGALGGGGGGMGGPMDMMSGAMGSMGLDMGLHKMPLIGGFFQNPNEVSACGCGESVMLKPAEPGQDARV